MYQVELVWNQEFHWVFYGEPKDTLKEAKAFALELKNMGDGARVKKAQVINLETDKVELSSYQIN